MKNIRDYVKINEGLDKVAIRELVLYADNNRDIYDKRIKPLAATLTKKLKKGEKLEVEKLGQSSVGKQFAADVLKSYGKEFDTVKINSESRKELQNYLAALVFHEIENNDNEIEGFSKSPYFDQSNL